jgi:NADPH oxidase
MVFVFGMMHYGLKVRFNFQAIVTHTYKAKDNSNGSRDRFGLTFPIARSSALVLHVDIAFVLFPVCRNLISMARRTPLNDVIPFDKNITFHKLVGWSIVFFSWVHTVAHWNNLARFSASNQLGFMGFILANLATGPGWSGYVMLIALTAMAVSAAEKARRNNFERFWYMHHLFIVFFLFWSIHGAFCMITPDFAPFCDGIGVFWEYWMYGGFAYLAERISREVRGRHKTYISKVIQHPSNVCEVQIKKEHTKTQPGQVCGALAQQRYSMLTTTVHLLVLP